MVDFSAQPAPGRSNVIAFPGSPGRRTSPKKTFERAYRIAEVARLEFQLAQARAGLAQLDGVNCADGEWRDYLDARLVAFREAMVALAWTPAARRHHVKMKQRIIGHVWLKAEGPFYDRLRDGLAADAKANLPAVGI